MCLLCLLCLCLAVKCFCLALCHGVWSLARLRILTLKSTHLPTVVWVVARRYYSCTLVLASHGLHLPIGNFSEIEILIGLALIHIHLLSLHAVLLRCSLHGDIILASCGLIQRAPSVEHLSVLTKAEEEGVDSLVE